MSRIVNKIAYYIAVTGSGGTKMPGAGTIASVNALFVFTLVRVVSGPQMIIHWWAFLPIFAVAWWATEVTLAESNEHDPSWITVDEWLAVMVICFALRDSHWITFVAAVALFRLFDIYKFGLIRLSEKLPGAWGVLIDDLVAAAHVILLFKIVPIWRVLQSFIFS